MLIFNMNWFNFGFPDKLFTDKEIQYGIHAGDIETSLMLALDPQNVNMQKAENFVSEISKLNKHLKYISINSLAKIAWQAQDLNRMGACGNAKIATSEKGQITVKYVCKKLLEVFNEIEKVPISFVSN